MKYVHIFGSRQHADLNSMRNGFKLLVRLVLATFTLLILFAISCIAFEEMQANSPKQSLEDRSSGAVPLIYSHRYNITAFGMEKLHPFDGTKYKKIQSYLIAQGMRDSEGFLRPLELSDTQLQIVHTPEYLKSLKKSRKLAKILEVGPLGILPARIVDWRILKPMRSASGGTLLACRNALNNGVAINIGGGYHHADADEGGGFCVYSDVPIAIEILRREKLIKTALIIDTDAHQGNGFANVARSQAGTHVLDFYDVSIYPYPKVEEDMPVPLAHGTDGGEILKLVRKNVPEAIARFKPDLVVYNAGSDVLESDPLSSLRMSPAELNERDLYVVSYLREKNIPVAMVLAGGYSKESAMAQARSIESIVDKFDRR